MRLTKYLPILAICAMTTGCNTGKHTNSGIDFANLDTTAVASADFYQYACGGWMKNHPLTDEYSRFGSFDMLRENNRLQLQGLIEELAAAQHPQGSIAQKVGGLYNIAMDSVKLNSEGVAPIKDDLDKIANIQSPTDMYVAIAEMQKNGMFPYFYVYVGADDMNSDMNMVHTYQGGLGMGERDFYLEDGDEIRAIRKAYKNHIVKMFELAGYDKTAANKAMEGVMKIEMRLAKAARSNVDLRNPNANYNKRNVEQLNEEFASFGWDNFFSTAGFAGLQELDVSQPEFMKEVETIVGEVPMDEQIAYLQWNVINNAAEYLSDDIVNQNFEFYGKAMSGKQELQPLWKRAVSSVDGSLGESVGSLCV